MLKHHAAVPTEPSYDGKIHPSFALSVLMDILGKLVIPYRTLSVQGNGKDN